MNSNQAKQIPITDLLFRLGIKPVRENDKEAWYHSPISGTDKTPSFKVNKQLNAFHDFSSGEKGTIIDLGIQMFNCSVSELLKRLELFNFSFCQQELIGKDSTITILDVKPLTNIYLLKYGEERRIESPILKTYCSEVIFSANNKKLYAIGFRNNREGFELRNKFYKGGTSPKAITHLTNGSDSLCVFEGFFDFLSFLHLEFSIPKAQDYLILNSTSFIEQAIQPINNYDHVNLFLDNDRTGKNGTQIILSKAKCTVKDYSFYYEGFSDVNDFLMHHN